MSIFRLIVLAAAMLAASLPASLQAQPAHSAQQRGELLFHYGIVPAELVLAHAEGHAEREMHKGRAKAGTSHLVVALFERASGRRIADAEVHATVGLVGGAALTRRLEPMTIADQPGFGGFFSFAAPGVYRIRVEARRPGAPQPASAEFEHRVPGPERGR